jgi:hypothetical protein
MRVRIATWFAILLALSGPAAGQVQQTALRPMLERLASEAAAYEKLAQEVTGQETIHLRELKAPTHKFKLRVGESAVDAHALQWNTREIVSLYGVSTIGRGLHEIRQVIFVDGKKVQGEEHAQQTLEALLTSSGDQQKLASLKQLEKYTAGGAATDFGPLILLFAHGGVERYEFTGLGRRQLGTVSANAYHFKQLDGSEGLTLFGGQTQKLRMEGELWMAESADGPLRLTLASEVPDTTPRTREEATVDYIRSPLGALLPAQIEQLEIHGEEVTSESIFDYGSFQKLNGR